MVSVGTFQSANLAEDACLLRIATARAHRLLRIANDGLFICTRHASNTWRAFVPGAFGGDGWQRRATPEWL